MLAYLAARPGEDVTREELLQEVWGYRGDVVSRTVDTTLQRLRSKVEREPKNPAHILTVHGLGYRFEPRAEPPPPPSRHLPVTTPLIGRDADLRALGALLVHERLVSLVGPGGIGKTAIARTLVTEAPDAVFCDLTAAATADDVRRILSLTLGVPLIGGKGSSNRHEADERLGAAVSARGAFLLVLDNLEQTGDDGPLVVSNLLRATREVTILVTSRERLGHGPEAAYELAPLTPEAATELFVARARQARPGFGLADEASEASTRALVRRLDGLPLAVELAAARAGILGPADMLQRLDDRFRLLASRDRDRPDRQRTLRGALDWSWDLLDDDERRTLAWCSVFRGGFDADAVDAVLELGDEAEAWPIDVVESLRSKSLLTAAPPANLPAQLRLGMLESVREYAGERLDELGLRDAATSAHRAHYLALGEALAAAIEGPDPGDARMRLNHEIDNLEAARTGAIAVDPEAAARAALVLFGALWGEAPGGRNLAMLQESEVGIGDPELQFELTVALVRAHRLVGDPAAGAALAERAVQEAGALGGTAPGTAALARGMAEQDLGQLDVCERSFREADAAFAAAGDVDGRTAARAQLAYVMSQRGEHLEAEPIVRAALAENRSPLRAGKLQSTLGLILGEQTRWEEADVALEAALESHRRLGDRRGAGIVLSNLGAMQLQRGRKAQAEARFVESLKVFRDLGDARLVGMLSRNLGVLALAEGRDDEAEQRLMEAFTIHQATGDGWNLGRAAADLGELMLLQGRYDEAESKYRQGLDLARELGDRRYCAIIAGNLALLDHVAGRLPEAATKYATALRELDESTGARPQGYYRAYAAAMHAESGDVEAAGRLLGESRERLEQVGDAVGLAVLEVCTAVVELATAAEAHGEPERARLAAQADARLEDLGDEDKAFDVRVALQLAARIRLD